MDTRNVLMAVILSTIIIVGWQVLVVDPELKKSQAELSKVEKNVPANSAAGTPAAPTLNNKLPVPEKSISRTEN